MRRTMLVLLLAAAGLMPRSAVAKTIVEISAGPNPAVVGDRVVHHVQVGVSARLDLWVSAAGFEEPRLGTLPTGAWRWECCPAQTEGAPAWHYRSSSAVAPDAYRFGAVARARGTYPSTAAISGYADVVWIRVA